MSTFTIYPMNRPILYFRIHLRLSGLIAICVGVLLCSHAHSQLEEMGIRAVAGLRDSNSMSMHGDNLLFVSDHGYFTPTQKSYGSAAILNVKSNNLVGEIKQESTGEQKRKFGVPAEISAEYAVLGHKGHGPSKNIYLFDAMTGEFLRSLKGFGGGFGYAIAVDGEHAYITNPDGETNWKGSRMGLVFKYDLASGQKLREIKASSYEDIGKIGYSISILENGTALVGAKRGACVLNLETGDVKLKYLPLDGPQSRIDSGIIDHDDQYVAIGAPENGRMGQHVGACYIFDRRTGDQLYRLVPKDPESIRNFGASVAIFGRWLLVGAPNSSIKERESGEVFVFDLHTGKEIQRVFPRLLDEVESSSRDPEHRLRFGVAIAGAGEQILIGSSKGLHEYKLDPSYDIASKDELVSKEPGMLELLDYRSPKVPVAETRFGSSVSLSADKLAVGAFGMKTREAHVFDLKKAQKNFSVTADDFNQGMAVGFANDVAVFDNRVVVSGSPAVLLDATNGKLVQELHIHDSEKINPAMVYGSDIKYASVALNENFVLLGLPGYDYEGRPRSGVVDVFDSKSGKALHRIVPDDSRSYTHFGCSVSVSGDLALIGTDAGSRVGLWGNCYLFRISTGEQLHRFRGPILEPKIIQSSVVRKVIHRVGSNFGRTVFLTETHAVIADTTNQIVYIFDARSGQLQGTVTPPSEEVDVSNFGCSLAVDGRRLLVGANKSRIYGSLVGRVFMFDLMSGESVEAYSPNRETFVSAFGSDVALGEDFAIIGSPDSGEADNLRIGEIYRLSARESDFAALSERAAPGHSWGALDYQWKTVLESVGNQFKTSGSILRSDTGALVLKTNSGKYYGEGDEIKIRFQGREETIEVFFLTKSSVTIRKNGLIHSVEF